MKENLRKGRRFGGEARDLSDGFCILINTGQDVTVQIDRALGGVPLIQ